MSKKWIGVFVGLLSLGFPGYIMAQTSDFSDVTTVHMNRDAIEYLKENKIVEGYTDGSYKPENRINRAEFIKIIVASQVKNASGSNCFSDVKREWFASYVCTAQKMGIIEGYPDGSFRPGEYINFAEASKIISKALKIKEDVVNTNKEWFAGYVKGLEDVKAIPSTIDFFDKNITRGEMAEIIWRLKARRTDKVSQTYTSITSLLPMIASCDALKEKFDNYQTYYRGYNRYMIEGDVMIQKSEAMPPRPTEAPAMSSAKSGTSSGQSAADYSATNVQVTGVDEADIIKNDGEFIYMIKGGTVKVVKAYPPKSMKVVYTLDFEKADYTPQEMYVNGDQLVVIGQTWDAYPLGNGRMIRPYQGSMTKVFIFDITDRSQIKATREVAYEGSYNTSRRIDNRLYLVLNDTPQVWIWSEVKKGEHLIPYFQDGTKDAAPMAGCADIRYFPGYALPNYMIVSSIPLDNPNGIIDREVFLGGSDNVYASQTNLFVATNKVNYGSYTDWDWKRDRASTLLFKFNLKPNGRVDFASRGEVPGTILNQFSMDQDKGYFRIATTIHDNWPLPPANNVFALNAGMITIGSLENIASGESIYSTRFLGDRLYMVTFEQIDPLFVIDLKNPKAPKILGELKIPGFSNYLHPYDETHLIGFGKDTMITEWGGVRPSGFRMGLFDVSDVANPKLQSVVTLGDEGTDSELLQNHKALLFSQENGLLAFPIQIVEKVSSEALECNKYLYDTCPTSFCQQRCIPTSCRLDDQGRSICTSDCNGLGSCIAPEYDQYRTSFLGAIVYSIDPENGFKELGRVTHLTSDEAKQSELGTTYNYWNKRIQRVITIGEYLYSISQEMIKANELKTVKDVNSLDVK
ncbi:beta-propeller domain-containing protein [Candidatus Peregrinibacteria bacterium]|nr:beta-propeller domain-containing protein [Candidatus Peregrinibacteria bacterium]